jgi:hypothetical protein
MQQITIKRAQELLLIHQNNTQKNQNRHTPTNQEEDHFCLYKEAHIQKGIQNCKHNLIGKVLSDKIIPKQIIQNTLMGIWGNPKDFKISEVEEDFLTSL